MKLLNWSPLSNQKSVLEPVPPFSHYWLFSFYRVSDDYLTVRGWSVQCSITIRYDNEWMVFHSSRKRISRTLGEFLNSAPNLLKTPLTSVLVPPGKVEVEKSMGPQESLINDLWRMQALHDLCDHVLRKRSECFYRDFEQSCIERSLT